MPGIGFSPDKMLQARIFSYADAHRYRLGTHYEALPVNAPSCPVHHYHKDGAMRFLRPTPATPTPTTSRTAWAGPREDARFAEPPLQDLGDADRYNHRDGNDDYTQPGNLFRLMSRRSSSGSSDNIADAMQGVPQEIIKRQFAHFYKADPGLRRRRARRAQGVVLSGITNSISTQEEPAGGASLLSDPKNFPVVDGARDEAPGGADAGLHRKPLFSKP